MYRSWSWRYTSQVCVFTEVETKDTINLVCTLLSEIETAATIFEWTPLVAKRHQHLLISMSPTKGTKQGYHSTMYKYESC